MISDPGCFLVGCVYLCLTGGIKAPSCPPPIRIPWLTQTMTYSKRNSFTTFCLCLGWEWRNQGASVRIHAQWVSGRHPGRAGRAQVRSGRTLSWVPALALSEVLFGLCVSFPGQGLLATVVFRCGDWLTNKRSLLWAPPGWETLFPLSCFS